MVYTFENSSIQLEVNPRLARWSASGRQRNSPSLENIQFSVNYQRGLTNHRLLDRWPESTISDPEILSSPHGPLRQIRLDIGSERGDIHCSVSFALPEHHPILLWKVSVENRGSKPIHIDEIELFSAGYIHRGRFGSNGKISFPNGGQRHDRRSQGSRRGAYRKDLIFFSNGWQSWSYSGTYQANDHYKHTRLGFLRAPVSQNVGTPRSKRAGMFASDMYGVLGEQSYRNGILIGFLSQKQHFGSIEAWIGGTSPAMRLWANGDRARLDPGERMITDWACLHFLHLDNPDPLAPYLNAVAREHNLEADNHRQINSPTGWCSWYQFSGEDYTGAVTANDIDSNIEAMEDLRSELPIKIIQIDDGFESQIGDWFQFNQGFPDGPSPLAGKIRERGFTPGIWLAPFIVHPRSKLASLHKEWLLKDRFRRPVNAGFLWGTLTSGLDLTHPDALAYVSDVVKTAVNEWGFTYIKLDFLYAAALKGRYRDPTKTRAQVLRSGLKAIRTAAGEDTFILACGCPLGPAIGIVDAMRISADTARRWRSSFSGHEFIVRDEPSLPSAFNAVHNSLTRAQLHQRWWINDPDCLLLRPETKLTQSEIETIASVIALTGGSLLLSDHLPDLPPDRLQIAKSLLPLIEKRPHILDLFDSSTPKRLQLDVNGPTGPWHLIALFNWDDEARDLPLQLEGFYLNATGEMYAREFWSGETFIIPAEQSKSNGFTAKQVSPHGVVLYALRPRRPHSPQYLGSDMHISQGLEVVEWQPHERGLGLCIQRPGRAQGEIEITTPHPIGTATQNGTSIPWSEHKPGGYIFNLEFNQEANIEIIYQ